MTLHTIDVSRDGWVATLAADYDEYNNPNDVEWLGTFTDRWEPGAMSNYGADSRGDHYADCAFWVPPYTARELADEYSRMGIARGPAWEKATAQLFELRDYARRYTPYILTVTVTRLGVELGSDSIGDVCFDDEHLPDDGELIRYVDDYGVVDEAIGSAQDMLDRLTEGAA